MNVMMIVMMDMIMGVIMDVIMDVMMCEMMGVIMAVIVGVIMEVIMDVSMDVIVDVMMDVVMDMLDDGFYSSGDSNLTLVENTEKSWIDPWKMSLFNGIKHYYKHLVTLSIARQTLIKSIEPNMCKNAEFQSNNMDNG